MAPQLVNPDQMPQLRPALTGFESWLDDWFSARWRALASWMLLVGLSQSALEYGAGPALDHAASIVAATLQRYVGFSPPEWVMLTFSVFTLLCWFQPIVLRLDLIRGVLWVMTYAVFGTALTSLLSVSRSITVDVAWRLVVGQCCGLPGLVAIGARSRHG